MKLNGHELVYFGHSAFLIKNKDGINTLIDPWISNPSNKRRLEEYVDNVDYILITHGHGDHIGDAEEIGKRYNAEVIAMFEVTNYLRSKGLEKLTGMNIGGTLKKENISFTMVEAAHSSTIHDGEKTFPGGSAAGFVISMEDGFTLYHMGDTGLFGGLKMITELYHPDLIMIPIGGHYTMGPREAAYAISVLNPKMIIPMHYRTFPVIDVSVEEFIKSLDLKIRERVIPLSPGEILR